jgi:hypothetical protein
MIDQSKLQMLHQFNKLKNSRLPVAAAAAQVHRTVTLQLAYKASSSVSGVL